MMMEAPQCEAQCDTEMRDVNYDPGGGVEVGEPMSISQQEVVTNPNPPQGVAAALTAPEETPAAQVQRFRVNDYCANSNLVLLTDPAPNSSRPRCDEAAAAAAKAAEPSAKRTKRESWLETMAAAHAASGLSGALAAFDAHLATSDAAVAAQPFRGTIDLNAVRRDPKLLAALLNVAVRDDGQAWMLEPRR